MLHMLCVFLYLKGNIDLCLYLLMFTKQAAIHRSCLFKGWLLSYNLPFKMAGSGYQTLCRVRLPVSDISNSLPHSLVSRQADCGTAGHCSVLPPQVLFQQTAVQQHIFTPLPHSPLYQHTLCQYTHTQHNSIYPVLSGTEATIQLFSNHGYLTNIHCTVPPCC